MRSFFVGICRLCSLKWWGKRLLKQIWMKRRWRVELRHGTDRRWWIVGQLRNGMRERCIRTRNHICTCNKNIQNVDIEVERAQLSWDFGEFTWKGLNEAELSPVNMCPQLMAALSQLNAYSLIKIQIFSKRGIITLSLFVNMCISTWN